VDPYGRGLMTETTAARARNTPADDPAPALTCAHQLVSEPDLSTAGLWPRTAARLTRIALERAVNNYWAISRSELASCPMTMRLLMLEEVLGRRGARDAYLLWSQLSDATHPHPYELMPMAAELRRWIGAVTALVDRLSQPQPS
jgi:hypothetical protein